jgi:hypothetical protein
MPLLPRDLDAHLIAIHRNQADLLEQIQLSKEIIEQSQEFLRKIDDLLAKSPLKP